MKRERDSRGRTMGMGGVCGDCGREVRYGLSECDACAERRGRAALAAMTPEQIEQMNRANRAAIEDARAALAKAGLGT